MTIRWKTPREIARDGRYYLQVQQAATATQKGLHYEVCSVDQASADRFLAAVKKEIARREREENRA